MEPQIGVMFHLAVSEGIVTVLRVRHSRLTELVHGLLRSQRSSFRQSEESRCIQQRRVARQSPEGSSGQSEPLVFVENILVADRAFLTQLVDCHQRGNDVYLLV